MNHFNNEGDASGICYLDCVERSLRMRLDTVERD